MTTQTPEQTEATTTTQTTATPELGELAFSDYVMVRRKEKSLSDIQAPAAPAAKAEQKESTESAPEETEADEEEKAKSKDAEAEEADESEEDAKDDEGEKPAAKKKGGFQRRIEKLIRERETERKQREALEARLAELERSAGTGKPGDKIDAKKTEAPGKPKAEDFESHADWVEAVADWKAEQKLKERDAQNEQAKFQAEREAKAKAFDERQRAFAKATKDYNEVVEGVVYPPAALDAIVKSEIGPQLAYELAQDADELARLSALEWSDCAREMGKLEAKLQLRTASEATKKLETKKLTQAPKPIEPVGQGKGTPIAKSVYDPNLSFSEYEKLRREQMKRKRA